MAAAARLFTLLGLAACFAALRCRITTFHKERLILGRKRECLPTIAAHELLICGHISLSSMLPVSAAFEKPSNSVPLPDRRQSQSTDPRQSPFNSLINHDCPVK